MPPTWDLLTFGRASFMMDFVALAMLLVLPLQFFSIWIVKVKRNYSLHKTLQIILFTALMIAVLLFEIDVRIHGWAHLAEESPYFDTLVYPVLFIHLVFSISATLLLIATMVHGLRNFGRDPKPGPASKRHRRLGWLTTLALVGTSITGWLFYYFAFIA